MIDPDREQLGRVVFGLALPRLKAGQAWDSVWAEVLGRIGVPPGEDRNESWDFATDRRWWMGQWAKGWLACGCPHVMLDTKLAASLMATEIPRELAKTVAVPWGTFAVTIPAGILQKGETTVFLIQGPKEGVGEGLRPVRVLFSDRAPTGEGHTWSLSESWDSFSTLTEDVVDEATSRFGAAVDSEQRRRMIMVIRAVFGACAELSNRAASGELSGDAGGARCKRLMRGEEGPRAWSIRISRDIVVDCREYVRAYASGDRHSIAVQYMRRGHWRNQACGPRMSQRKFIHIEPHWVGPDDAPIAVRSHVLPDVDGGT